MEKKKISVIIPVYKVEKFIHACVDSVLQQTYDNLEVIPFDKIEQFFREYLK